MGKLPVASLQRGLSVTNFILIRFWSHVAKFFSSHKNVNVSEVDKMIGFSPGPFQVMDQVSIVSIMILCIFKY